MICSQFRVRQKMRRREDNLSRHGRTGAGWFQIRRDFHHPSTRGMANSMRLSMLTPRREHVNVNHVANTDSSMLPQPSEGLNERSAHSNAQQSHERTLQVMRQRSASEQSPQEAVQTTSRDNTPMGIHHRNSCCKPFHFSGDGPEVLKRLGVIANPSENLSCLPRRLHLPS